MHSPDAGQHLRCVLDVAALAGLVALGVAAVTDARQQRRSRQPRAQPSHLQTWESEGGGVPVGTHRTAAQIEARGDTGNSDATVDIAP